MSDSVEACDATAAGPAGWVAEAQRIARRTASDPSVRDDLAQETLARALAHPPGRADASPGGWIARICRNLRVDRWRDEARARNIRDRWIPPPAATTGEESLLARERRREVRRALCTLPGPQRRALILRFFSGWSFERIGRRLGMPEATARTRVHRALRVLRAQVAALRALTFPLWPSFKPALAALVVLAAQPRAPSPALTTQAIAPVSGVGDLGGAGARRSGSRSRIWHDEGPRLALDGAEVSHSNDAAATRAVGASGDDVTGGKRGRAARPRPAVTPPAPPADTAAKRIDFEDDEIAGDLVHPDEPPPIAVTTRSAHPSLIELRRHFEPELVKTLEDL